MHFAILVTNQSSYLIVPTNIFKDSYYQIQGGDVGFLILFLPISMFPGTFL
jgi:hypothetical protein